MKLPARFVLGLFTSLVIAAFFGNSVIGRTPGPHFGPWSALEPVTAVNSSAPIEYPSSISHDGLRLYIQRTPGDIWVSPRDSTDADWQTPVMLPSTINSAANEAQAFESIDGHWLFFGSSRPGGLGGMDIWASWRKHTNDDMAWETPVNITSVNSAGFENAPMLFVDESIGLTQMYFGADPGLGGAQPFADIYLSTLGPNGFGTPALVTELSVDGYLDGKPWVRRDGLEIFFVSYRQGTGGMDGLGAIYTSTRSSTDVPWSAPWLAMDARLPTTPGDRWVTTPVLSWDGSELYVAANQPGTDNGDVYVAHREKIRGRK